MTQEQEDMHSRLSALLDGELPDDRARQVGDAVEHDQMLRGELKALQATRSLLQRLPRQVAPGGLADAILKEAEHRCLLTPASSAGASWVRRVTAAAILLMACGLGTLLYGRYGQPVTPVVVTPSTEKPDDEVADDVVVIGSPAGPGFDNGRTSSARRKEIVSKLVGKPESVGGDGLPYQRVTFSTDDLAGAYNRITDTLDECAVPRDAWQVTAYTALSKTLAVDVPPEQARFLLTHLVSVTAKRNDDAYVLGTCKARPADVVLALAGPAPVISNAGVWGDGPRGRAHDKADKASGGRYKSKGQPGEGLPWELDGAAEAGTAKDRENQVPESRSGAVAPLRPAPTATVPTSEVTPPVTPTAKPATSKKLPVEGGKTKEGEARDARSRVPDVMLALRKAFRSVRRPLTGWMDNRVVKQEQARSTHADNLTPDLVTDRTVAQPDTGPARQAKIQALAELANANSQVAGKQRRRLTRLYITVNLKRNLDANEADAAANQAGTAVDDNAQQSPPAKGE